MKAFLAFTIGSLVALTQAGSMTSGGCPKYESNLTPERANHTKMGGLWYEFMNTDGWRQREQNYDCASWNLLAHSSYGSFDLLHHSMNITTNDTKFSRHHLTCGKPGTEESQTCSLKTEWAPTIVHKMTVMKNRDFQIIDTDLFSYMVASACYEYKLAHWNDFVVLTREKEPSIWTRNKILNVLTSKLNMSETDVKSMEKG